MRNFKVSINGSKYYRPEINESIIMTAKSKTELLHKIIDNYDLSLNYDIKEIKNKRLK